MVIEYLFAWWGARQSRRRHEKRLRLWLEHLHRGCGAYGCDCKERIEKLKPKEWRRG